MSGSHRYGWRERFPTKLIPTDLTLVGFFLVGAYPLVLFEIGELPRVIIAAVLLCFLPGYVTVAALFPGRDRELPLGSSEPGVQLSLRERLAVSFGVSIALLPMLGLALGVITTGFSTTTVLHTVSVYIVLVGSIAAFRRLQLPESDRFVLPINRWFNELKHSVSNGSLLDRALTVTLICSILLAGGVFVFAVGSPVDGQTYTDFHVLTAEDGEYVSGEYPDQLVVGESAELAWGIHNFEQVDTEYTVIVTQERVTESGNELTRLETIELDRQHLVVPDGEREVYHHEISPPLTGENLRISYYLYRGDVSDSPTPDDAYRHLHLWIDIEPST